MTADELMFFPFRARRAAAVRGAAGQAAGRVPGHRPEGAEDPDHLQARYGYAFVSLRRMKGCPEVFIIVSFGLARRLDSPASPWRWSPIPTAGPITSSCLRKASWTAS